MESGWRNTNLVIVARISDPKMLLRMEEQLAGDVLHANSCG